MRNRTKAGIGMALITLLASLPLSAASVAETVESSVPTLESIDECSTPVVMPNGDMIAMCSEEDISYMVEAAEYSCGLFDQVLSDFEVISCYYIGNGRYSFVVRFSCEPA